MGEAPTSLSLPPELPYPITLTRLLVSTGQTVRRGDRMLEYSFLSSTARKERARRASANAAMGHSEERKGNERDDGKEGNDMVGSWECPIEGEVDGWVDGIKPGKIIEERHASKPIVRVTQPCTHPVQLHGMCGICGADLTTDDYMTRPVENVGGPSRYPGGYEIAHDAMGVTVSTSEARRLESLTRDTLLKSRRLSLIVDLDQTIIHTTVDPTVGEWMAEISDEEDGEEEDKDEPEGGDHDQVDDNNMSGNPKGKERQVNIEKLQDGTTTTPPGSPKLSTGSLNSNAKEGKGKGKRRKSQNPNAEALKDVARFQLADDLPSGSKSGGQPIRWYYTKPRPGLQSFLTSMSKLYELHVYTMGTRSYADAICNVIDPEGKIFGGRILSRDESGSMSSKSLKRLFPTDHSMVVVIDDRSDVWGDCPNLVQVIPYDFFVGIGDINGVFLPPQPKSLGPTPPPISATTSLSTPPATPDSNSDTASSSPLQTPSPSSTSALPLSSGSGAGEISGSVVGAGIEDAPSTEKGLVMRAKILDEMSEARPLAKLQQELEERDDWEKEMTSGVELPSRDKLENGDMDVEGAVKKGDGELEQGNGKRGESEAAHIQETPTPGPRRKPLLNPNDYELDRIGAILSKVHKNFYRAYDARKNRELGATLPLGCDVELIIPDLKSRVLDGCVILFSAVIPRNQDPETSDIWLSAESFGARCVHDLTSNVTHVVAAAYGTEKTIRASRIGLKVVWLSWLQDSIARWERMDENRYIASSQEGMEGLAVGKGGKGLRDGKECVVGEGNQDGDGGEGGEGSMRGGDGKEEGGVEDGDWKEVESQAVAEEVDEEEEEREGERDRSVQIDPDRGLGGEGQNGLGWDYEWNEEDDREMEEFLRGAGESDFEDGFTDGGGGVTDDDGNGDDGASEAGSVGTASASGRKRVRYADEESLPLESFKDPSPTMRPESPPKKRPRALLLPPPGNDEVPPENRFTARGHELKEYGKESDVTVKEEGESRDEGETEREEEESGSESEGGGGEVNQDEEDDEFAQMLLESVDAQEGDE